MIITTIPNIPLTLLPPNRFSIPEIPPEQYFNESEAWNVSLEGTVIPSQNESIRTQNAVTHEIENANKEIISKADSSDVSRAVSLSKANSTTWSAGSYLKGQSVVYSDGNTYEALVNTSYIPKDSPSWKITSMNMKSITNAIGTIMNPMFELPFKNDSYIKRGVGFVETSRGSEARYFDEKGNLQVALSDEPRFEKKGCLIEPLSSNFLLHSGDMTQPSWVKAGSGVTTPSATEIVSSTNKVSQGLSQFLPYNFPIGDKLSVSAIVSKKGYRYCLIQTRYFNISGWQQVIYDFDSDTFVSWGDDVVYRKSEILSNGKVLLKLSMNNVDRNDVSQHIFIGGSDERNISFIGDGVSGLNVFGVQVENQVRSTSYIPTNGTIMTRTEDYINVTADNLISSGGNWTLSVDVSTDAPIGYTSCILYAFSNVDVHKTRLLLFHDYVGSFARCYIGNSSSVGASIYKSEYRMTISCETDSFSTIKVYIDGQLHSIGTNSNLLEKLDAFQIGRWGLNSFFLGHISNLRFWDKVLTAEEIKLV